MDHHRRHIRDTMLHVKGEMQLLKQFEAKQMTVDEYVERIEALGQQKVGS